jgi:subtilisin family serine protease
MRSQKLSLVVGGVFVLFVGTLSVYEHFAGNDQEHTGSRTSNSVGKSKSEKNSDRVSDLEASKIAKKVKSVENEPSVLFNDPAISQAWGLTKSDAARAWAISKGSHDIVVAVIDTGADVYHEDLVGNFWNNPGETGVDANGKDKATNGIDDDKNGYVDDVHGWNFVSNNNLLTDNHGHGTHICGIIGSRAENHKGISGVSPEVSLMVLKYYDPKVPGTDNLKNTVAAIHYAVKMGAKIINYSGGGTEYSQDEKDAIMEAQKKDILFVAAAGNEHSNSDKSKYYPADYGLSNVISVTAVNRSTEVLSSSNWGTETVDIAAPGEDVLSTLPGSNYGKMTGTSQATAYVSGAAVLVMARRGSYKAEDVKKYLLATGDAMESLSMKTRTSRRINFYNALTILDQGVGLSGVVAANLQGKSNVFASDPNLNKSNNSAADASDFGKALLKILEKSTRLGGKQNNDDY